MDAVLQAILCEEVSLCTTHRDVPRFRIVVATRYFKSRNVCMGALTCYVRGEYVVVVEWYWWLFYLNGGRYRPLWAYPLHNVILMTHVKINQ